MRGLFLAITVTMLAGLLSACGATTHLTGMWSDPEFNPDQGRMGKVLIIGLAKNEGTRRAFEQEMKSQFAAKGVQAMASLEAMPFDVKLDSLNYPTYFGDKSIDAILVTRLIGVDQKVSYSPGYTYAVPYGYYNGFYGYYGTTYGVVNSPGYLETYDIVNLETNLYRVSDRKLVWSGISETFDYSDVMDGIKSFSKNLVPQLVSKGFFRTSE